MQVLLDLKTMKVIMTMKFRKKKKKKNQCKLPMGALPYKFIRHSVFETYIKKVKRNTIQITTLK